jgi:DNA-directed RNA polymerase II subunit RPB1
MMKEVKEIKSVEYSFFDTETILRLSVCEIVKATIYNKSLPRRGGVNDLRLGSCDKTLRCDTCSNNIERCPGHYGHITLAQPVFHIAYISYVLRLLRCICPICVDLLDPQVKDTGDFTSTYNLLNSKKRCGVCNTLVPGYKQVGLTIKRTWSDKAMLEAPFVNDVGCNDAKRRKKSSDSLLLPLGVREVLSMFQILPKRVSTVFGIENPCSWIISLLLVPPPIIRPSINFSASSRSRGQDDLTSKLVDILKCSNKLKNLGEDVESSVLFDNLQMLVATYISNEGGNTKKTMKRSSQPEKSVVNRWKGKKGRIRGNIMGKRVDYSARTVVTGDPFIDCDEVVIPVQIAKTLTTNVHVTPLNLRLMQQMIRRGHNQLDGALSVTTPDGKRILLEFANDIPDITHMGWKVERYLKNGDYVLINRQPSLRKKSIMAHKVIIFPNSNQKAMSISLAVTPPYNADFDGIFCYIILLYYIFLYYYYTYIQVMKCVCMATMMWSPPQKLCKSWVLKVSY